MAEFKTLNDLIQEAWCLAKLGRFGDSSVQSDAGLGGRERDILAELDTGAALTMPQLARATMTTRQNVRVIINRLLARGLVRMTINPDHQKSHFVEITAAGTGALEATLESSERFVGEKLSSLAENDVMQAVNCLRRVCELMTGEVSVARDDTGGKVGLKLERDATAGRLAPHRKKSYEPAPGPGYPLEEGDGELPVNLL